MVAQALAIRATVVQAAAEKAEEKAAAENAAAEKAAAEKAAAEKADAEKAAAKERRERDKAAKRNSAAQPSSFPHQEHLGAPTGRGSASALSLVHVQDGGVLEALQACLEGTDIGRRDQRPHTYYDGPYDKLVLKEAWQVENTGLWKSYEGAQDRVMGLPDWTKEYMGQQIRPELYRSSGKLPGKLLQSCNEVR